MPSAFHENGVWKMRWPRSPAKKSASVRRRERGQEARFGDPEVLRLVDDGEVVSGAAGAHCSATRANIRRRPRPAPSSPRARVEDRPERLPLAGREAGLAPEPRDFAVVLDARNEPGINDFEPFAHQKRKREFAPGAFLAASASARGSSRPGDVRLPNPRLEVGPPVRSP